MGVAWLVPDRGNGRCLAGAGSRRWALPGWCRIEAMGHLAPLMSPRTGSIRARPSSFTSLRKVSHCLDQPRCRAQAAAVPPFGVYSKDGQGEARRRLDFRRVLRKSAALARSVASLQGTVVESTRVSGFRWSEVKGEERARPRVRSGGHERKRQPDARVLARTTKQRQPDAVSRHEPRNSANPMPCPGTNAVPTLSASCPAACLDSSSTRSGMTTGVSRPGCAASRG